MNSQKNSKSKNIDTEINTDSDNIDYNVDEKTNIELNIESDKKTKISKRTIMYLNDDDAKPVTAGGVLIYKKEKGNMMILVIDNSGKYEDIGGKIDPDDKTVYHAISREVEEETNSIIKSDTIIERLKDAQYIYVPNSKYVIFLVEATKYEMKLRKDDFGDKELHDNFPRTIGWISRHDIVNPEIIKFKMNWRMKSKSLFDKLLDIENQFKLKKKLF